MPRKLKKSISSGHKGDGHIFRRGKTYWLEYWVDGSRNRVSLRKTDSDEALKEAKKYLRPVRAETEAEVAFHIAQARQLLTESQIPLAEAWVTFKAVSKASERTLRDYASYWNMFHDWLKTNHPAVDTVDKINRQVCLAYGEWLAARPISARTCTAHLDTLSLATQKLLLKAGSSQPNPWQFVERRARDTRSKHELSKEQVQVIFKKLADPTYNLPNRREWEVVFHLGTFTGQRLGDCVLLSWDCLDLTKNLIRLVPRKTARFARNVQLPIHPELGAKLQAAVAWREPEAKYICPTLAERYLRNAWGVNQEAMQVFEDCQLAEREKIEGRARLTNRVGFHSLRHSFVSFCANAGVPLPVVQALVGHGSPAMTRHYTHVDQAAMDNAIRALPTVTMPGAELPPPEKRIEEAVALLKSRAVLSPVEAQVLEILAGKPKDTDNPPAAE